MNFIKLANREKGESHKTPLVPNTWSADQALAVVELLDDLRERICMHYQFVLHELQHEQRAAPVNPHLSDVDDPF